MEELSPSPNQWLESSRIFSGVPPNPQAFPVFVTIPPGFAASLMPTGWEKNDAPLFEAMFMLLPDTVCGPNGWLLRTDEDA